LTFANPLDRFKECLPAGLVFQVGRLLRTGVSPRKAVAEHAVSIPVSASGILAGIAE
jgi:hypothetical protein